MLFPEELVVKAQFRDIGDGYSLGGPGCQSLFPVFADSIARFDLFVNVLY
jgi:hypothetical protein